MDILIKNNPTPLYITAFYDHDKMARILPPYKADVDLKIGN